MLLTTASSIPAGTGAADFPSLTSALISSPWHTSFGGNYGVLTCLAREGSACAMVGGGSIAFNYGVEFQAITCEPVAGAPFFSAPYTAPITCTATSGLPVRVVVAAGSGGVCAYAEGTLEGTFSTGSVTVAAVGTCSLTCTQTGDAVYAAAAPVTLAFWCARPRRPPATRAPCRAPPPPRAPGKR